MTELAISKLENNIFSEKKAFLVFDNNEIMISNDQTIDNSINILETKLELFGINPLIE